MFCALGKGQGIEESTLKGKERTQNIFGDKNTSRLITSCT